MNLFKKLAIPTIVLSLILVVGFFLRIVGLSEFPNGFIRDEAYLGYNAYSILLTGKDINSNFLPLFIESFLYTPAGYAYLSIPFIKLFGLNIFSVRLASSLMGFFTIPVLYLLVRSYCSANKKEFLAKNSVFIGLVASFLLAINPWHLNLSRTASVSTVIMFFIVLGMYLLQLWIESKRKLHLIFAFLSFFASLLFYIAPYSFVPFILIAFFIIYRHVLPQKILFIGLTILILIPIIFTYLHPDLSLRARSLSLAGHPNIPLVATENASRDGVSGAPLVHTRIFHNKISLISQMYASNFFSHFDYDFMFSDKGFPERYRIPEVGLLYPIMLVLIVIGIPVILKTDWKLGWLLLFWTALSAVGSSFANDDIPNMQRTLFMLPPLIFFASCGFVYSMRLSSSRVARGLVFFIVALFAYQVGFYFHQYYIHESAYRPWYRQDGYERLVESIKKIKGNYAKVVVTNRESAPTLFLSFFGREDPSIIQSAIKSSTLKDTDRISFGSYQIVEEECPVRMEPSKTTGKPVLKGKKGILYVNSSLCKVEELEDRAIILDTIYRGDGSKVFYLLAVR